MTLFRLRLLFHFDYQDGNSAKSCFRMKHKMKMSCPLKRAISSTSSPRSAHRHARTCCDVPCGLTRDGVSLQDCADAGWWMGEVGGRQGVFPDNFVKLLELEKEVRVCTHS